MPNRIEARSAKAALTNATGRLPQMRLFSTPLFRTAHARPENEEHVPCRTTGHCPVCPALQRPCNRTLTEERAPRGENATKL